MLFEIWIFILPSRNCVRAQASADAWFTPLLVYWEGWVLPFCFSVKTTRLRPPLLYVFPAFKIDLLFYTPEVSRGRGGVRSSLTEVDLGSQSGYPPRPPAGVGPTPRGTLSGADPYESAESRRRHLWPGGGPTALILPPAPAMLPSMRGA